MRILIGSAHASGRAQAIVDPAGALQNLLVNWSRLFSTAHWLPHNLYEYQTWELFLGAFGFFAFVLSQWRFRFSLNLSQAWIFVHLLPLMLLSPAYIWTISSGPSCYLYIAAAGPSILLALGLDWIRRRVHVLRAEDAARRPAAPVPLSVRRRQVRIDDGLHQLCHWAVLHGGLVGLLPKRRPVFGGQWRNLFHVRTGQVLAHRRGVSVSGLRRRNAQQRDWTGDVQVLPAEQVR